MSIDTIILYGSAARGDQNNNSDVDLFGIGNVQHYKMVVKNSVNMAIYPSTQPLEMAKEGSLFLLHIIEEGKVIYDTKNNFQTLKTEFEYKKNYTEEINYASNLGWVLLKYAKFTENFSFLNKRIAWCVRTILIAKAAEKRTPLFSTKALASFVGYSPISALIENKSNLKLDLQILVMFEKFLNHFTGSCPSWVEQGNTFELESKFENFDNKLAFQTLRKLTSNYKSASFY